MGLRLLAGGLLAALSIACQGSLYSPQTPTPYPKPAPNHLATSGSYSSAENYIVDCVQREIIPVFYLQPAGPLFNLEDICSDPSQNLYSISVLNNYEPDDNRTGWFGGTGFNFIYDKAAKPGEHVTSIQPLPDFDCFSIVNQFFNGFSLYSNCGF